MPSFSALLEVNVKAYGGSPYSSFATWLVIPFVPAKGMRFRVGDHLYAEAE